MAKKILIIDDEPHILKMVEARLKAQGYDIVSACDGEEGLAKAAQEKPNLIITDVMMPKVDGFEVCRRLRSDEALKHIPIIMLTARGQAPDIKKGMEKGADAYVAKPFEAAALVGIIAGFIGT